MMPAVSVLQNIVNFYGHDVGRGRIAVHRFFMAMMPDMSVLQFIVNFYGHDAGRVRIAVHRFFLWP